MNTTNKLAERLAKVSTSARPEGSPAVAPAQRATPAVQRRAAAAGERWEDRVRRATFYIDVALLEELAAAAAHSLNKSEFVREAIRRHLTDLR